MVMPASVTCVLLAAELAGDYAFKVEARNHITREMARIKTAVNAFKELGAARLEDNRGVVDARDIKVRPVLIECIGKR